MKRPKPTTFFDSLTLTLDSTELKAIKHVAIEEGVSAAEIVRRAIRAHLAHLAHRRSGLMLMK